MAKMALNQRISKRFCFYLGALTYALCCLGFGANVAMTLVDFFERETIQTSTKKNFSALAMPDVVVCHSHHFIDAKIPMLTVQEYKKNTNNPNTFIKNVTIGNREVTASEELLTHPWGWCKLYRFDPKEIEAKPDSWMAIRLNNISAKIFLLNHEDVAVFNSGISFRGSQFVKIDIPNDMSQVWVPIAMEFQKDNTGVNHCNPEAYGRKDCMEQYLKRHFKNVCHTPWLWSMIYRERNDAYYRQCNNQDEYDHSNREFTKIVEIINNETCTEPCRTQRFITLPEYYRPTDNIQGWEELHQSPEGEIIVMVGLYTLSAKYTIRNFKVEFNGLVSAVGGSLGLFLGFSVLTTLQSVYSSVGRKINVHF